MRKALYGKKKKRKASVSCDWRLLPWRSRKQTNWKWGILYDWLGEHTWLSLVDPKLGAGAKIREASVTDQVLAVLGQWLLRLLFSFLDGLLQVEGQNSTFIYGFEIGWDRDPLQECLHLDKRLLLEQQNTKKL